MPSKILKNAIASILSFILIFQSSVDALAQVTLWKERSARLSQRENFSSAVPPNKIQFASLPTTMQPLSQFPPESLLSNLSTHLKPSSAETKPISEKGRGFSKNINTLVDSIPFKYGTVQKIYDQKSSNASPVVLIQDIHLNSEAQTNISALLQNLIDEKKISLIGL